MRLFRTKKTASTTGLDLLLIQLIDSVIDVAKATELDRDVAMSQYVLNYSNAYNEYHSGSYLALDVNFTWLASDAYYKFTQNTFPKSQASKMLALRSFFLEHIEQHKYDEHRKMTMSVDSIASSASMDENIEIMFPSIPVCGLPPTLQGRERSVVITSELEAIELGYKMPTITQKVSFNK
jgi:hypothetical protein